MNNEFDTVVRVRISRSHGDKSLAFGYGTFELLEGVKQLGSLNRAAKQMGMAYSKAWKSIRGTEDELGFELIDRHGANGSQLTEKGERFLAMYAEMSERALAAACEVLDAHRSEF